MLLLLDSEVIIIALRPMEYSTTVLRKVSELSSPSSIGPIYVQIKKHHINITQCVQWLMLRPCFAQVSLRGSLPKGTEDLSSTLPGKTSKDNVCIRDMKW